MRLSKLEIKGFKSFADRTVISFDENIIGIIGPNGCGKSNIVDAIRWVLGEQKSRALRSGKMENVIFNGSKNRKAANMAEVSISFDNTKHILPLDYSNVTITRRLYRDGESEYLINDTACRLKDITSLFLDTGVDSDSYAIIELSMVDDILEDRDNARFRLFEHAAGINKYKKRKHETFNKLKHTEEDIERVDDLLFEINTNLKSLQQQARKVENYNKIKDKYKNLSIQMAQFKLKDLNETYERLSNEDDKESDAIGNIVAQMKKYEADVEKNKQLELDKEKELSVNQKSLNTLVAEINEFENEKKVSVGRNAMFNENEARLNEQIDENRKVLYTIEGDLEKLKSDKTESKEILDDLSDKIKIKQNKLDEFRKENQTAKENLDEANKSMQLLVEELHDSENMLTVNQTKITTLKGQIESSSGRTDEAQKLLQKLGEDLEQIKAEKVDKVNELNSLLNEEAAWQDQLNIYEHTMDEDEKNLLEINRELDVKETEYKISKNVYENMEGYPESIKFLKQNADSIRQAPLLLDIINCNDLYRQSIESFLEPYLNHYVVEKYEDALRSVELLASSAKGRANFLILNTFSDYQLQKTQAIESCTNALDIIEVEEKYKKLITYLLGNVFIVENENLDPASLITKISENGENIFLLSKSGKLSRGKHILSGGSVGLFTGKKIGRVKNLENLNKEILKLSHQKERYSQQINDLQGKMDQHSSNSKQARITVIQEKLESIGQQIISNEVKYDNQNLLIKTQNDLLSNTNDQINDLSTDLNKFAPRSEKLQSDKVTLQELLNEAHLAYQKSSKVLDDFLEEYNQSNEKFHVQQNKVNSVIREIDYKTKTISDLENQIKQNEDNIEEMLAQINVTDIRLKELDKLLFDKYQGKESSEKIVNEAEASYYESKSSIHELEEKLIQERQKKDQSNQLLQSMKERVHEIKLELNSLKERLSAEFQIDINAIIDKDVDPDINEEEVTDKLDKMKNRLENYGPINPMAIEAFEELQERLDFIETQKDDLTQAKNSLLATIKEIDDTAKVKFLETFEHSRQNFIQVFRTLFSEEDDCDLILSDINDPLESTIDIIAKPKGKKPLSISQLSGGEKTLTAVALLFALYLLKPAPFCIFDEVDAPLDDLNIEKFNKIIREFSKESQFGVITHNKSTIAAVDVIYGITMSEEGVSKVVPVDFRGLKENVEYKKKASSN